MQDDVTDGTHWLIDQGWADPAHIAIVGASYGGYAALMGVIKEPKLYACAAAFAPVTDLNRLVGDLHNFAFKDVNIPRIKGAGQDLDVTSPVENADKVEVPVLLMHGRNDFTVPVGHSEEMERALKRAKKPVEAVYLEKADHYFAAGSDRLAWLSGLDRLLAANLRVSAAR
jgi:dipeptidyl aminopeptidase/acylaminoacyl peptidase